MLASLRRRGSVALLATSLLFFSFLLGSVAAAQGREAPPDVTLSGDLTVPPMPEGFVRETAGTLTFEMPAAAVSSMRDVIDSAATEWMRITGDLGAPAGGPLLIRVGTNPDEMARLAPIEAPPPEYAVGVAYPALDLVLLTLTAPETWERPDVESVFAHELSHIALHRAVMGEAGERDGVLPRWFDEGIAIHEAGERSLERVETLWQGTISGQLIELDRLDHSFPARPHAVSLAYAESADFVAWLLRRRQNGPEELRQVLARVRRGESFEAAIEVTFTRTLGQLEDEWREALGERYGAGPLLLGSGIAWAFIGILIVLAFRKRRTTHHAVLARWSEEERIEDEREALRARAREILAARRVLQESAAAGESAERGRGAPFEPALTDTSQPSSGEAQGDAEGDAPESDVPADVPKMQPEVPSIVWEGDRHTLH